MPVMEAALWALAELFEGAPDAMPPHFDPNEWEDLWLHAALCTENAPKHMCSTGGGGPSCPRDLPQS